MRHVSRPSRDELPWPAWIALGILLGWLYARWKKPPVVVQAALLPKATAAQALTRPVQQRAAAAQPILAAQPLNVSPNAFGQVTSVVAGSTPRRVLETSRTGARRVTIITDAEIRILDSASVTASRGMIVPKNQPVQWPYPIGGDVELYAIKTGAVDANVSVLSQPVSDAGAGAA